MRYLLIILFFPFLAWGKPTPSTVELDFDSVSVSQIVRGIFNTVLKDKQYFLHPAVISDTRLTSFRFKGDESKVLPFLSSFLNPLGFVNETVLGVTVIKPEPSAPVLSLDSFVYRPLYRDSRYLIDQLASIFTGTFSNKRSLSAPPNQVQAQLNTSPSAAPVNSSAVSPTSAAGQVDKVSDILVFTGTLAEISKLKQLLSQIDVVSPILTIRGFFFEYRDIDSKGFSFNVAANLFNSKLGVSIGNPSESADFSVQFKNLNIDAAINILNNDNRFQSISSPSARIRSGSQARFQVGQDVPTLSSFSSPTSANGQPVQNVTYQNSGVILEVTPFFREKIIDLDISCQISDFVATKSGVNNTPTLIKRQVQTSLSMAPGDLILIGGLSDNRSSKINSRGFFNLINSDNNTTSKTNLMLLIQVTREN